MKMKFCNIRYRVPHAPICNAEDENYKNRTLTLALLGTGLAPPPFKSMGRWFVQLPGTTSWHKFTEKWIEKF